MNNLEICKRIAEIEFDYLCIKHWKLTQINGVTEIFNSHNCTVFNDYNPLTDDTLCFQLMVKYNVLREGTGDSSFRAVITNWSEGKEYYRGIGDTLNKAICLAIIEKYKGK